jgi:HAD superfamily hydrolase (TIGR01509 family)
MPLGGVIFDWDGVVINSASLHKRSWEILAAEVDLPLPENHFVLGFGKRNEVIIPEILKWTQNRTKILKWGKRKEEIYRELGKEEGIPILKGIRQFLQALEIEKIPCAIGTSTEKENLALAFDQLKIGYFFSGSVCSEDVSQGKPDPEVFIKAAQILKQPPENCVVLEDSTHGIEAAKCGKMKALGLSTTRQESELFSSGADHVVSDPTMLNISLLKSLFMD